MPGIFDEIASRSNLLLQDTIEIRRYLHKNPELSYKEFETSSYIRKSLAYIGFSDIKSIAGTGIIAHLKGEKAGHRKIVLRAELDALPIIEESDLPYASLSSGIMHACGHDSHMAMLLSTARLFYEIRDRFSGDIYFLFQPGEELAPGGASMVIEEGVLQEIKPDAIIAQHVLPELQSGRIGVRGGRYMASSDEIYIDVFGIGGHAALPGASTDQITISASLVADLKSAVQKLVNDKPVVFGIGKFIADGACNVIPSNVHIEGTLRTFDESLRNSIHQLLERKCREAEIKNVSIKLEIRKGYPVLINNEGLVKQMIEVSDRINGLGSTDQLDLRMSSEDFAFYSQQFPVLFYRLGVLGPENEIRNLHTSQFDIYEEAMETGIRTMAALTFELLNS
jgi:amidohydrolase